MLCQPHVSQCSAGVLRMISTAAVTGTGDVTNHAALASAGPWRAILGGARLVPGVQVSTAVSGPSLRAAATPGLLSRHQSWHCMLRHSSSLLETLVDTVTVSHVSPDHCCACQ